MGVSKNSGTPKSSILIGFSIINHPFWGTTIFGNTHINISKIFPFTPIKFHGFFFPTPPRWVKQTHTNPHMTEFLLVPTPVPPRYMLSRSPTWMLQEPMQLNQPVLFLRLLPRPPRFEAPKLGEKYPLGGRNRFFFQPLSGLVVEFTTKSIWNKLEVKLENLPQIGMKVKNNWNHHVSYDTVDDSEIRRASPCGCFSTLKIMGRTHILTGAGSLNHQQ